MLWSESQNSMNNPNLTHMTVCWMIPLFGVAKNAVVLFKDLWSKNQTR